MTHFLTAYIRAIENIRATGNDTELSYRPAIEQMLQAAAAENDTAKTHTILHEPARVRGSAPDFCVMAAGGAPLGYVECKKRGEDLERLAQGEQLQRYAALSPNILLTDGWRWLWLRDGKKAGGAELSAGMNAATRGDFIRLLETFYAQAPEKIGDSKRLANALAVRCINLRDELIHNIGARNDRLSGLYEAFKSHIYREMERADFADAFAQTTIYSLLLAKLRAPAAEPLDLHTAERNIPQTFALIRELSNFISALDNKRYADLHWVLRDVLAVINNMDAAAIVETMSFAQTAGIDDDDDPFLYFYENFLAAYDKQLRKVRGVYYTPLPVVRFIVRSVDEVLKRDFGINEGLANRHVTALDFAAGTGTFMLEVMRVLLNGKSEGERKLLAHEHALQNLYGFELLIAPYVIAHLKLSQFLADKQCGIDAADQSKPLKIFLTDTLSEAKERTRLLFLPALDEEIQTANQVKKDTPILAIIGNPPYAGHSQNKDAYIKDLVKDAYYGVDGEKIKERNLKWLQDDYVKFIRFAEHKMETVERGIVAVITNHGFLDNPTFRGMRRHLMTTFNQLYFLDLHGNANKKETTPDGGADKNVFDIKQGVCISLLIKNPDLPRGVFHYDLFGERQDKYDFCEANALSSVTWKELKPESPFYLFIPQDKEAATKYNAFPSVTDIFNLSSVGIVTARDKLTIAFDEAEIRQRATAFAAMPTEQARQKFNLGDDKRDWSVEEAQKDLNSGNLADENFQPIAYRPFDTRYTYYTGKSRGFHCMPRKDVMNQMLAGENLGLVTVRQVAEGNFNHAIIVNSIIESRMTLSNKGIGYLYPLYCYDGVIGREYKKTENLKPEFRQWINDHYGEQLPPESILAYVYAVLHSPRYRTRYADFLRGDFPRIPFVKDITEFHHRAAIGQQLINAHLLPDNNAAITVSLQGANLKADRVKHQGDKLFFNQQSYFSPIPREVFEFKIGGYQPLDKYLKSRKGRELTLRDVDTIKQAAAAIAFTLTKMQEIDA